MATVATNITENSSKAALQRLNNWRALNQSRLSGPYLMQFDKTLTAAEKADFDASGDFLEFFTFPQNTYLAHANVTVPDMDSNGAPQITLDLMAGSAVLVNNDTAGQAGGDVNYDGPLVDVSGDVFKLKIETVAATVPASYSTGFSVLALVYVGSPVVIA